MIKVFSLKQPTAQSFEMDFLGIVDLYESFQYNQLYNGAGAFNLKVLLETPAQELLKAGNLIFYEDFCGVINAIQINLEDGTSTLTVSGYEISGLLALRVITYKDYFFNGKAEKLILDMVGHELANARQMPFLSLNAAPEGISKSYHTERNISFGSTLLEEVMKICEKADYGFKVRYVRGAAKPFEFVVYQGEDRTRGTEHQYIISRIFNNVINQDYVYSESKVCNSVFVTNDNIDNHFFIEPQAFGLNRHESILQSSQTKDKENASGERITITDEELNALLLTEANVKIEEPVECFDADLDNTGDLKLGDKITVLDKQWNIEYDTRVVEKQTTIQNGNKTITLLFGNDI